MQQKCLIVLTGPSMAIDYIWTTTRIRAVDEFVEFVKVVARYADERLCEATIAYIADDDENFGTENWNDYYPDYQLTIGDRGGIKIGRC